METQPFYSRSGIERHLTSPLSQIDWCQPFKTGDVRGTRGPLGLIAMRIKKACESELTYLQVYG
jgi:hypothetical protein